MDAKTIELPPLDVTDGDYLAACEIFNNESSTIRRQGRPVHPSNARGLDAIRFIAERLCRERQLSERDQQIASMQKSLDRAVDNETRLLKEVQDEEWIEIEIKGLPPMPNVSGNFMWSDVLLIWDGSDQEFATYWDHRKGFILDSGKSAENVTHWKVARNPSPSAPKEAQTEVSE